MTMKPKNKKVLKEIENNRNHSWFEEIKQRSQDHLDKSALQYRGKKISYREFIDTCEKVWAPALKAAGIQKGTEIVLSMSSTPELCYLMGAASVLGARLNFISDEFDYNYVKEICDKTDFKYIFITSDRITNHMKSIEKMPDKTIIPVDLNNSLNGKNPFSNITDRFSSFSEEEYKQSLSRINNKMSLNDFLERGKTVTGELKVDSTLDDVFTTSYSSGTSDGNKPKGIVHKNRHYIVMGRYHDSKISGIPPMNNSVTFSTIPTQSNSYIASIISDTLMEGATVALDPIVSKEYFLFGMKINQPTMSIATTSSWLYAAKYYYSLPAKKRKYFKLPKTIFPVAVGEALAPGEEKFLNKFIADLKCGTEITKLPHSISKMSTCGGDCEHGSILIRVLRSYANLLKDRSIKEPIGLRTYDFVTIKALRPDGTYCGPNEYGRLVANSDCTMVEYRDDPKRTANFFIEDAYGIKWGDMGCHGFIDRNNNVYMKGRISEDYSHIPAFLINDEIQKDTKNILSSSVIDTEIDGEEAYICYIDFQPFKRMSEERIKTGIIRRLEKKFGKDLINNLYFRILKNNEEFPLTGCLKRDRKKLREIGLTPECEKATSLHLEELGISIVKKIRNRD